MVLVGALILSLNFLSHVEASLPVVLFFILPPSPLHSINPLSDPVLCLIGQESFRHLSLPFSSSSSLSPLVSLKGELVHVPLNERTFTRSIGANALLAAKVVQHFQHQPIGHNIHVASNAHK